jgi:hypothetical protein
MLAVAPRVISSIMGLYPASFIADLKARGILWFATATTVAEAKAAEEAGADAIVAQGMEAGGHRGAFDPELAERQMVGLIALVPQVADAVSIPVIAAGGIADGRGVAAALILGASAVQIGTGLLRTPEAMTPEPYAERLSRTEAHETAVTRAFSGRARPKHFERIRPRCLERPTFGSVSRPAGPNICLTRIGTEGRRCRAYAGLGRTVCKTGAGRTGGEHYPAALGERSRPAR